MKIFNKSILRRKKEFIKTETGGMSFKTALQDVEGEIAVMKHIIHPNCLKLHEVLDDEEGDKLYMVLDFA
jgi:serine/threonine protein kinase